MEERKDFDLVVHKRDAKTGRVTQVQPYRMFSRDGIEYFERPKGSGNLFFRNNEPAGRMIEDKIKKGEKHLEWAAPLNADQQLAQQHASQAQELAKVKAELEEMKREEKYGKGAGIMKKAFGSSEKKNKKEVE